jgi:transposase, IS30 family
MGRQGSPLSGSRQREVIRMAAKGCTKREIIDAVGISGSTMSLVLKPFGGVYRPEHWAPLPGRLSLEDRVEIKVGLRAGESFAAIGRRLGRATSTISREVGGQSGRQRYSPVTAHRRAEAGSRRPKPTKLLSNPSLCARVIDDLQNLWSPELIAGRLRRDFPDDPEMWVSHETIYKSLYVQGRGELNKELTRCLRLGRERRKPRGQVRLGVVQDIVPISERPPEVEDRAVPGHWEGDLIVGSKSRSAVGTLVERTSRYTILLPLQQGHTAPQVREAITKAIRELPAELAKTLTWDRGTEMAEHVRFTVETGVQIYFCAPRSPWQRPTNENTNGLLRQYLPKGSNLAVHSSEELAHIAASLNNRPRKVLDYMTPSEVFSRLVAATG